MRYLLYDIRANMLLHSCCITVPSRLHRHNHSRSIGLP
jgi:hypothetical protein